MKKMRFWTPTEIERFIQMWRDGVSIDDCAKALGRSYRGIEKARARFGLEPREGKNRRHTVGEMCNPRVIANSGEPIAEHGRAMKRETDWQARMWRERLQSARRA